MEKIKSYLNLTIYDKGGYTLYCDYYFYNGKTYETGTTRAGGWGYDKPSTVTSEAINHFNHLYNLKRGIKWENDHTAHCDLKNRHFYGIYKDKTISYGIGLTSVLNCIDAFNNVKVINQHYGKKETFIKLEITNTKEQIKKQFIKNDKKANNEKTTKEERKKLIKINKKLLDFLGDENNEE